MALLRTYRLFGCIGAVIMLLPVILFVEAEGVFSQQTARVSVDSSGNQGNCWSSYPSISSDGRYVAFSSLASNLVAGDTNGAYDIFVHDRQTGVTTRVSVDSSGNEGNDISGAPSISSDGRYVAFESYASNLVADTDSGLDIFVHDRQTGMTSRVSVNSSGNKGNGASIYPSMSSDGRYVAFESDASNLVACDTNGWPDIFVHDRQAAFSAVTSLHLMVVK
jgi:Tol biopolymer transport system component